MSAGGLDDVSDDDEDEEGCSERQRRRIRTLLKSTFLTTDAWERLKEADPRGELTNHIITHLVTRDQQIKKALSSGAR